MLSRFSRRFSFLLAVLAVFSFAVIGYALFMHNEAETAEAATIVNRPWAKFTGLVGYWSFDGKDFTGSYRRKILLCGPAGN